MTINCKLLVECYPFSRPKIYEDLTDRKYGDIHQVWTTPGHLFISVKEGRQLFTFDTISTNRTAESDFDGFLDIKHLESPIIDIFISSANYNLIYIVEVSGTVHCWKYKAEKWTFISKFDICNVNQATLISICLHPTQNALFWCEKRLSGPDDKPLFCICKRQLPNDDEKLRNREIGSIYVIIHNCPSCKLYPASSGLYIVMKNKPPLVSMVILWINYKMIICIGKQRLDITDFSVNQAIEFNKLAIKIAGCISQVKPKENQLEGIIYKIKDMSLSAVLHDGSIVSIQENEGDINRKRLYVDSENVSSEWFECGNIIGSLHNSKIVLYRKHEQGCSLEAIPVTSPDGSQVLGLCRLSVGTVWPSFYTENNIYTLQWSVKDEKQTIDTMLKSSNFQTPAVELALLEQRKFDNPSPDVYRSLATLRQERMSNEGKQPSTKLGALLEPYLKDYWTLDSLQQMYLSDTSKIPPISSKTVEEEVFHTISPQILMSMSARQSWLLILSQLFPHQVLKVLTSLMDFDTDDVGTSQIQRWQCILASENTTASAVSSDVAVPLFEHICRLMLLIQPQKLVQFVKLCQMINNQKVGVSAFIRKRQALQYYDRALECLPPPKSSEDSDTAVTAYVELLLASDKSQCETSALRMLIDHKHWKDSVDLIQKYKDNQTLYANLYLILFRSMSQKEVLSQHAEQMFSALPKISCFTQISSFLTPKEGLSARDIFATTSCDIPLHTIKSSLLKFCKPKP